MLHPCGRWGLDLNPSGGVDATSAWGAGGGDGAVSGGVVEFFTGGFFAFFLGTDSTCLVVTCDDVRFFDGEGIGDDGPV